MEVAGIAEKIDVGNLAGKEIGGAGARERQEVDGEFALR